MHTKEYVETWEFDDWGILCHSNPAGGGSEYDEDKPERIEQALFDGHAYKVEL